MWCWYLLSYWPKEQIALRPPLYHDQNIIDIMLHVISVGHSMMKRKKCKESPATYKVQVIVFSNTVSKNIVVVLSAADRNTFWVD